MAWYDELMNGLVLDLTDAANVKLAGGKGAALARLVSAGFAVPDGFVITTTAFNRMDSDLESEILKAFDKLDAKYVAVRSSAAAEDGAKDAWAGQLDTYLNVGRPELIDKVQRCWQSTSSDRAKSYAEQKGLEAGSVAVVVQEMIQSETSGIVFSVNPISGNKKELVIEAGFGLNEPIVSGEITPDTYIVAKTSGNVIQKHISKQEKQYSLGDDGKNQWQVVKSSDMQKLSDEQIDQVAKVAAKLEDFFGYPIDSEWTFAGDKLYILQARPITTLA